MSMNRISLSDVRGMFGRTVSAARAIGLDTTEWRMHEGSSTNGISWKLDMPGRSLGTGFGGNFIGMTAREAYMALQYMARAWEIVAESRDASN